MTSEVPSLGQWVRCVSTDPLYLETDGITVATSENLISIIPLLNVKPTVYGRITSFPLEAVRKVGLIADAKRTGL